MRNYILILLFFCYSVSYAQHIEQLYYPETDTLVLKKISQWQDLKFGLLMHWGPYSQWGIVESWSICPEDYGWCERKKGNNPDNYFDYVKEYEKLKSTFNPVNFNPEKWAKAANDAGMKYVVFTTKHHDGFCMFDTQQTDYKVTDTACAFHSNPKSNIAKEIFSEFRKQGLWTGAYFSKPDWNNPNYWDPYFPPKDRNVNYDPEVYPDKWEKFVEFTQNQIMELMTDYGKMDILWLDGGWVAKTSKNQVQEFYTKVLTDNYSGFLKNGIVNQDIRMDELVSKVRKVQPGLIVVDRAVEGKNQNYLTPENRIPEEALPYPWESCIIAGGGWSYAFDAQYMDGRKAIHMLIDIVAKGGNLLLNIAPSPTGEWDEGAYNLLLQYGKWLKINGEAIYNTRPISPYKWKNVCYTQSNDAVYAIVLIEENQEISDGKLNIGSLDISETGSVKLLDNGTLLEWKKTSEGIVVNIPSAMLKKFSSAYAIVIKIEK